MDRPISKLLFTLVLLSAAQAHAEMTYQVAPSVGNASISKPDGYNDSSYIRIDGSFHPVPQFAANLFVASYTGFKSASGNDVTIKVNGYGAGVTGRWPVHPHVHPYVRLDYMLWRAEAVSLDRTLAEDSGGSAGLALGMQFPIRGIYGVKAEFSGYNDVSGADIRQFSLGATFEF
ncbi:MAG TPA: outer membrane beta-barrel protein [Gallionella sp.]